MDIFYFMPLELWKDMAERFLDPTSFGRLRQVNKALRDKLDEESKEKMVKRCTIIVHEPNFAKEIFMNQQYTIFYDGIHHWTKNGKSHRDNDLPAVTWQMVRKNGIKMVNVTVTTIFLLILRLMGTGDGTKMDNSIVTMISQLLFGQMVRKNGIKMVDVTEMVVVQLLYSPVVTKNGGKMEK